MKIGTGGEETHPVLIDILSFWDRSPLKSQFRFHHGYHASIPRLCDSHSCGGDVASINDGQRLPILFGRFTDIR